MDTPMNVPDNMIMEGGPPGWLDYFILAIVALGVIVVIIEKYRRRR